MFVKKNYFSKFFAFSFLRYYPFRRFFWKKHSLQTSVIGDISYHVTHHCKALEEEISNTYTFMGQKHFIFNIKCPIIFAIFPKYSSTHFPMKIAKNSLLDLHLFIYTKAFLFNCTSKQTISPSFSSFPSQDITCSDVLFEKPFITNFYYRWHFVSCDTPLESSWGVDFRDIYTFMS